MAQGDEFAFVCLLFIVLVDQYHRCYWLLFGKSLWFVVLCVVVAVAAVVVAVAVAVVVWHPQHNLLTSIPFTSSHLKGKVELDDPRNFGPKELLLPNEWYENAIDKKLHEPNFVTLTAYGGAHGGEQEVEEEMKRESVSKRRESLIRTSLGGGEDQEISYRSSDYRFDMLQL